MVDLNDEVRAKFAKVLDNVDKLDFGSSNIISLINVSNNYESYEWDADFVGITKDGKIAYVFESGCSCNSPSWDKEEIPKELGYETTIKGLELELKSVYDPDVFDQVKLGESLDKLIEQIDKA